MASRFQYMKAFKKGQVINMRLWHKDLIPVLPRQQLLGQWRECCCIARNIAVKGTPNHLLVNKIMDYPLEHFSAYAYKIYCEMNRRGYKVDSVRFTKYITWFPLTNDTHKIIFEDWHNDRYLYQCLMNLQEKYDCGGISEEEWQKLLEFHHK